MSWLLGLTRATDFLFWLNKCSTSEHKYDFFFYVAGVYINVTFGSPLLEGGINKEIIHPSFSVTKPISAYTTISNTLISLCAKATVQIFYTFRTEFGTLSSMKNTR